MCERAVSSFPSCMNTMSHFFMNKSLSRYILRYQNSFYFELWTIIIYPFVFWPRGSIGPWLWSYNVVRDERLHGDWAGRSCRVNTASASFLSLLQHGGVAQPKSLWPEVFGVANCKESKKNNNNAEVNTNKHCFLILFSDMICVCCCCFSMFMDNSSDGRTRTRCVCTFTVQLSLLVCHCGRLQAFSTQGAAETGSMPGLHTHTHNH